MSRPTLDRRLKDTRQEVASMRRILLTLDDTTLDDLIRRGERAKGNDGFPSGAGEGSSGSIATPTEHAALAHYRIHEDDSGWWDREHDETGDLLAGFVAEMHKAWAALNAAKAKRDRILSFETPGRTSTLTDCCACTKPAPVIRSGFCDACYSAYRRAVRDASETGSMVDRFTFELSRRQTTALEVGKHSFTMKVSTWGVIQPKKGNQ